MTESLDLGIGMELISSNLTFDGNDWDMSIHPVYGEVKWNFSRKTKVNPYMLCKIGTVVIGGDEKDLIGAGYFGIGGGVEIGNFLIQLVVDAGAMDYLNENSYDYSEDTLTVSRVNLSFGFNFGRDYNEVKAPLKKEENSVLKNKLLELEELKKEGLINDEEYKQKREETLNKY